MFHIKIWEVPYGTSHIFWLVTHTPASGASVGPSDGSIMVRAGKAGKMIATVFYQRLVFMVIVWFNESVRFTSKLKFFTPE